MATLICDKEVNIWEEVCNESKLADPFYKEDTSSFKQNVVQFSPAIHHPAVFGRTIAHFESDENPLQLFDPKENHPALAGLVEILQEISSTPQKSEVLPPKDTCSPRDYLNHYVFPVLLPGLLELLKKAETERCFQRKYFKFNGCDFLTEYLYNNNPKHEGKREVTALDDIWFVREMNETHPRRPLPWSLMWSEEEAALKIQCFYRGYRVRRQPEVQQLREYQRSMRDQAEDIMNKISDFWTRQEARSDSRASARSRQSSAREKEVKLS